MKVAIRADGGPKIGFGHLVRTGALAEELLERNHTVTFATTTVSEVHHVCPREVDTVELPARGDPRPLLERIDANPPDIVLTDAYPVGTRYQETVREKFPLAVIQDDARHAVCADLFVNGNLHAPDLDYALLPPEPMTLLGTDYVLLRNEIRDLAARNPPWQEDPKRALVTMGGSDPAGLTPTVIRAFDRREISVDAIVGPGFSKNQERDVRDAGKDVPASVRVLRDPADLPSRMFRADFAVSTASSTTYELLALGTPLVSRPGSENQEPIAAALRDVDAATVLSRDDGLEAFRAAIDEYILTPSLRRERRERGRDLVDCRGVIRIADALEAVVSDRTDATI